LKTSLGKKFYQESKLFRKKFNQKIIKNKEKMEKEEIQSKIMEMNMLENRLKQLDQQLGMIEQQILEDEKLEENLKDLKNKEKSEAVLPLGGGIFVQGSVEKTDKVLVNIGSKILVEKSVDEAGEILGKRRQKLGDGKEELGNEIKRIVQSMVEIEKELKE